MSDGKFNKENSTQMLETTLGLLDAIEAEDTISQRSLAMRLGVALGLTNALLKRCVKKGLLKVRDVPAKRFAYYLTPQGFNEKSRLTAEYLSHSLKFFRQARRQYDDVFATCIDNGWSKVALYGAGELAEIATLAAAETGVELLAVIDPGRNSLEFCGIPVKTDIKSANEELELDAVVLTTTNNAHETYSFLLEQMEAERVLAPDFLYVSRDNEKNKNESGAA